MIAAGAVTGELLPAVAVNALPVTHILKLSIAIPLSAPLISLAVHTMVIVAPFAIDKEVNEALLAVTIGPPEVNVVPEPVAVNDDTLLLFTVTELNPVALPWPRHCSKSYVIVRAVIVAPVLLVNVAVKEPLGVVLPECKYPKANSPLDP